jgi:arginine:ornithine antiporter/lysine permease
MARFIGILGTIYGCWLIYASGLTGLLITAILYAPGTLVYIKAKKEKGEKCFETVRDRIILGVIIAMAILSLILIFNGTIAPF